MNLSVRVLRLETAIQEKCPSVGCDIRASELPGGFVVTAAVWGTFVIGDQKAVRPATYEEYHAVHELVAMEFLDLQADGQPISIQLRPGIS